MKDINKYKVTYSYQSVDQETDKSVSGSARSTMEVESPDISLVAIPLVKKLKEFCESQGARIKECEILAIEKLIEPHTCYRTNCKAYDHTVCKKGSEICTFRVTKAPDEINEIEKHRDKTAEIHKTSFVGGVLDCSCGWKYKGSLRTATAVEEATCAHLDAHKLTRKDCCDRLRNEITGKCEQEGTIDICPMDSEKCAMWEKG